MTVLTDNQRAILSLWFLVNSSLSAYYKLLAHYGQAAAALAHMQQWGALGIHKAHLARAADAHSLSAFLQKTEADLAKNSYQLTFELPPLLAATHDPPPLLYYLGNFDCLNGQLLAMVGTRTPSDYGAKISYDLAQYLVGLGFTIVSGLAIGVDAYAHSGALAQDAPNLQGKTVGVMGTGIDLCYPPTNRSLFADIVTKGGCLISEFLPNTAASKHTFPRRNRLVAGLALATVITEADLQSGSLISARLTNDQGKQVFVVPNRIDVPTSKGCHHLIREGATLIYHPDQIAEDLIAGFVPHPSVNMPHKKCASSQKTSHRVTNIDNSNAPTNASNDVSMQMPVHLSGVGDQLTIPSHLSGIYNALSDNGADIDTLVLATKLPVGELLGKLLELELLGRVQQVGGRYVRL